MASVTKRLREEATCPKCLLLMTDPMVIDCGHSFCYECITSINENQEKGKQVDGMYFCGLCRHTFQKDSLRPNKKLQSIIDTIKTMCYKKFCEEHGEKLHLYCEDDDRLICFCCERQPQHKGHVVVLAEDVCQKYKGKLQNAVTKLRENESHYNNQKLFLRKQRTEWEEKVKLQRQKLKSEFKNLRRFLHKEEEHYLRMLEEEKEHTVRKLQEGEDKLEEKIQDLQIHILELEKKCEDSVQNLMEGVKVTLCRSFDVKLELPEAISLDLHTMYNVPELYFDVRKVLKRYQVSVTLDPETAHNDLLLSEDGRKVTCGHPQKKPHSFSRFTYYKSVLGCEGFTSGRHYFEVHVGETMNTPYYGVGVCLASVQRDIIVSLNPNHGFWAIRQSRDNGKQILTWPRLPFVQEHLSTVGVFVDYDAGLISFYNAENGSHIFTFPKDSFSETLLPFFQLFDSSSLIMIPPDMSVKKEKFPS